MDNSSTRRKETHRLLGASPQPAPTGLRPSARATRSPPGIPQGFALGLRPHPLKAPARGGENNPGQPYGLRPPSWQDGPYGPTVAAFRREEVQRRCKRSATRGTAGGRGKLRNTATARKRAYRPLSRPRVGECMGDGEKSLTGPENAPDDARRAWQGAKRPEAGQRLHAPEWPRVSWRRPVPG